MQRTTRESYGEFFTKWDPIFIAHCDMQGVPWIWLKVLAMVESSLGLHPRVRRGMECPSDVEGSQSEDKLSWGLLQFRPSTAKDYDLITKPEKLNIPEYSIMIGAKHLRRLYRAFQAEEEFCIKAWNEGLGNAVREKSGKIDGYAENYWDKYKEKKAII